MRLYTKLALYLAAILATAAAAPCARPGQDQPRPPEEIRFLRWVAEGDRLEIPWEVKISPPLLRLDQRLGIEIAIEVPGPQLNAHGAQHDLVLMVRIARPASAGEEWIPGISSLQKTLDELLPKDASLVFTVQAVVAPGTYHVAVVLFDRTSGHLSVTIRPLRADPIPSDPLPWAFRDLPAAEFVPSTEGLDSAFQPDLMGRLRLPLITRRPVQIELLTNFSESEEARARRTFDPGVSLRFRRRRLPSPSAEDNAAMVLAALKPLTELSVSNGSLRITALDLARRKILFEQEKIERLDWPRLREALSQLDSNVISAQALVAQKENAAFFRQVVEQRIQAALPEMNGGGSTASGPAPSGTGSVRQAPLRVFIVLSGPMAFVKGSDLSPLTAPADCNCRIYHIRLRLLGNNWDELAGILKPLSPRRFDINTPLDFRRALAKILEDLNEK